MYVYARLGNNCIPTGNTLTSNEKFITPLSPVYYSGLTQTWLYPGHTGFFPSRYYSHGLGPKFAKAWGVPGSGGGKSECTTCSSTRPKFFRNTVKRADTTSALNANDYEG